MNSIRLAIGLVAMAASLASAQTAQTPAPQATPPQATAATATAPAANPYLREAAITQNGGTIHISANSPRPLAQALDALRQKFGWLVEYEDPQYLSKADIVERPGPGGMIMSLPAGAAFDVDVPAGAPAPAPSPAGPSPTATPPPPEEKTLQLILDAYNQSKNPGRFRLSKNEDGSYVVAGIGAQDEKGKISPQEALFDLPITLPKEQRIASETVELICQKIAERSHVQITLGVTPRRLVEHANVTVGGAQAPARALLAQALENLSHPVYWRFLFDPGSKGYFLDVHAVRDK